MRLARSYTRSSRLWTPAMVTLSLPRAHLPSKHIVCLQFVHRITRLIRWPPPHVQEFLRSLQIPNTASQFDYTLLFPQPKIGFAHYCRTQSAPGPTQLLSWYLTHPHISMSWFFGRLNLPLAGYIFSSKPQKQSTCFANSCHGHKRAPTSVIFVRCRPRVKTLLDPVRYPWRQIP